MMRDESRRIFADHHQTPELIWLTSFATSIELRVRFEDAEQLVFVGNINLAFQYTAAGRITNLFC